MFAKQSLFYDSSVKKEYGASQKSRETGGILGVKSDTNELISNVDDMSNLFNDYFVNVASKLKGPTQPSNFEHLRNSVNSKIPNETFFEIPEVSEQFVRKLLSRLDDSKATGLDNIGPRLLKMSANTIAGSITSLVNKSIRSCKFPEVWKNAKVMPLFKSGAKDEVNNYRPISISATNEAVHVPRPKTEIFKGSLSYSGAIIWNSIPLHIRNANSIDVFTANCSAWMKSQ